jgi:aryl-alcohol dehydrogenase-like predicted oxidoreductase
MKKRTIANTGLHGGVMGLGCNRLLDPTNADMVKVAHTAIDLGMNQFDGADVYGDGRCEIFLGQVLKERRNEAIIVSKFGMVRGADGRVVVNVRPEYARQACDASLTRLGMDHIDLYYQHRMDPDIPIEDTIGAMADLVKAGKVKAIGICTTTADLIRRAHKAHPLAVVQMEYSLMERGVEADVLPVCKELGITFVAYGPLTYAFLTGEVQKQADVPQWDMFRVRQSRFTEDSISHNLKLLNALNAVAKEANATPAQIALAWCLHRPWDVLPIPGSSQPHHLHENAAAADISLTQDQVRRLDAAFAPSAPKGDGGPMTIPGK